MSGTGIETNADGEQSQVRKKRVGSTDASSGSIAYREDPYNKPEHENTLRGRELVIFIVGYVIAVIIILALFESILPVVFAFEDDGTQQRNGQASEGARFLYYM